MKFLSYLRAITTKFFHRSELENEMDEELQSHMQHRADDLERSGVPRVEAERRARVEFGGQLKYREESSEALGGNFIESLSQDIRFSMRVLRKSPGFTAIAVLTLAMAIGANAVVFSVLNAMFLRPLNLPNEQSLYAIEHGGDKSGNESYPDYLDLRDRNRSFDGLAAFDITEVGLDTGGNPDRAWIYTVSGNYFDVLGIQPLLGQFFHESDEHGPNSAPYIVLTYSYWRAHFRQDRAVVGRSVMLNRHSFTIVGVAPRDFHGTMLVAHPDFFVPLVDASQVYGDERLNARGNRWISTVVGHLKTGVTHAQAIADLNSVGTYLQKTYPKDESEFDFSLSSPGLGGFIGPPTQAFLAGLMLLAGLILLAACANLGSLFAAHAADRARELAVRVALGATRRRILRQLFTQAMLISLVGGVTGLWVTMFLLQWLSAWQPLPRFPIHLAVSPDAHVYEVSLLLTLVSGILFGAAPIRQILRADPYQIIKSGATSGLGRRITLRDMLLSVQIAICAVLVTSSIVAVRGMLRSLHSEFGFDPQNTMLVDTDLNTAGYKGELIPAMQKRMFDSMHAIPGVLSVGLIDSAPLASGNFPNSSVFTDDTTDFRPSNEAANPIVLRIFPDYFHAAGTTLLAGRDFTWHDDKNSTQVTVINQILARKLFGAANNVVGRYFKMPFGERIQVVGVVEDGKYTFLMEDPQPAMFRPMLQSPSNQAFLIMRSSGDPRQLVPGIKNALRQLDGSLPFYMETWNARMGIAMFAPRMAMLSLGVLGVIGAILSVTGIFGLAAYSVTKRKKELGIRMALGAQRKEILHAALGRAIRLLAFGSAAGLLLGILATRLLAVIVYQATPRDPLVLTGAVVTMALLGVLATWIPAQRALSLDPVTLLREE